MEHGGAPGGTLLLLALIVLVFLFPAVRILRKAGRSGWWAVTLVVPLVNIVMVWVFAFADWPRVDPAADGTEGEGPDGRSR